MEIMDILENKIDALLNELSSVERDKENVLHDYQTRLTELLAENTALKDELEQEKMLKNEILSRIDTLLLKLKERTHE